MTMVLTVHRRGTEAVLVQVLGSAVQSWLDDGVT